MLTFSNPVNEKGTKHCLADLQADVHLFFLEFAPRDKSITFFLVSSLVFVCINVIYEIIVCVFLHPHTHLGSG